MNKKYYAIIALVVMALVVISLLNRVRENSNTDAVDDYVTFDLVESDAGTVTDVTADTGTEADGITETDPGTETDEIKEPGTGIGTDGITEPGAGTETDVITETGTGAGADVIAGPDADTQEEAVETGADDTIPAATVATYVFRNSRLLNDHYEKHGIEMGFASAAEYEAAASAVITNPAALFKTEKEDGDFIYYLEETNEFVVLSTDGYIRTYFNPGSGKAYFDRQ